MDEQLRRQAFIFLDLTELRDRQDIRFGGPDHDDAHTIDDWLDILAREQVKLNRSPQNAEEQFLSIAAVAFAALESIHRVGIRVNHPAAPGAPARSSCTGKDGMCNLDSGHAGECEDIPF